MVERMERQHRRRNIQVVELRDFLLCAVRLRTDVYQ